MGRGRFFLKKIALFFVITGWLKAQAYTPTLTASGIPVRWPQKPIHFELAGNPRNQTSLSDQDVQTAILHGLQRWSQASGGALGFDYWQGTDIASYPPNSAYDGLSMIYFSSFSKTDPHLSSNVLGLTQVWYDANTGRILETDIALNDRDFLFTTHVRDTSGYGSGSPSFANGKSTVFIENVITHELGHALGLSHSGGLQSSMLFMESPEQAHLSCDDSIAIHALYPSSDSTSRGALHGKILDQMGVPIFGAHVVAISRRRGTVLATALTDEQGNYLMDALEPGTYFLMTEPFYAGPQTLPTYYSGMRLDLCPNHRAFARTVYTDRSGLYPEPVRVTPGVSITVPPITPRCATEERFRSEPHSDLDSAPTLFPRLHGDTGFGVSDQLTGNGPHFYQLQQMGGSLEIHALSYSLYSPVRPILTLLDSHGNQVSTTTLDNVYQGESGYVNYDSALYADPLPLGTYYLKVAVSELDISFYPAGPVAIDRLPFLVITGSLNEAAPPLSSILANNARCQMDENFPPYTSPPGPPPRHIEETSEKTGFCGTIEKIGRPPGNPPGKFKKIAEIVGWFFPLLVMRWIALALKRPRALNPLQPTRDMRQSSL